MDDYNRHSVIKLQRPDPVIRRAIIENTDEQLRRFGEIPTNQTVTKFGWNLSVGAHRFEKRGNPIRLWDCHGQVIPTLIANLSIPRSDSCAPAHNEFEDDWFEQIHRRYLTNADHTSAEDPLPLNYPAYSDSVISRYVDEERQGAYVYSLALVDSESREDWDQRSKAYEWHKDSPAPEFNRIWYLNEAASEEEYALWAQFSKQTVSNYYYTIQTTIVLDEPIHVPDARKEQPTLPLAVWEKIKDQIWLGANTYYLHHSPRARAPYWVRHCSPEQLPQAIKECTTAQNFDVPVEGSYPEYMSTGNLYNSTEKRDYRSIHSGKDHANGLEFVYVMSTYEAAAHAIYQEKPLSTWTDSRTRYTLQTWAPNAPFSYKYGTSKQYGNKQGLKLEEEEDSVNSEPHNFLLPTQSLYSEAHRFALNHPGNQHHIITNCMMGHQRADDDRSSITSHRDDLSLPGTVSLATGYSNAMTYVEFAGDHRAEGSGMRRKDSVNLVHHSGVAYVMRGDTPANEVLFHAVLPDPNRGVRFSTTIRGLSTGVSEHLGAYADKAPFETLGVDNGETYHKNPLLWPIEEAGAEKTDDNHLLNDTLFVELTSAAATATNGQMPRNQSLYKAPKRVTLNDGNTNGNTSNRQVRQQQLAKSTDRTPDLRTAMKRDRASRGQSQERSRSKSRARSQSREAKQQTDSQTKTISKGKQRDDNDDDYGDRTKQLETTVKQIQQHIKQIEDFKNTTMEKLKCIEDEQHTLRQDLNELQTQTDYNMDNAHTKLYEAVKDRLTNTDSRLANLDHRISNLDNTVANLSTNIIGQFTQNNQYGGLNGRTTDWVQNQHRQATQATPAQVQAQFQAFQANQAQAHVQAPNHAYAQFRN
jgi:hypothetical protein